MRNSWIIVDGYNSIHKLPELLRLMNRDLYLARRGLVRMLEKVLPRSAERITVVFDGSGSKLERDLMETSAVEILYSPASDSADSVIERMVAEAKDPRSILVVTSDNMEANAVAASGAATQGCDSFFKSLGESSRSSPQISGSRIVARKLGTLEDHFPD